MAAPREFHATHHNGSAIAASAAAPMTLAGTVADA
jgi:hypothetical protein